jgi:hypothetical protein
MKQKHTIEGKLRHADYNYDLHKHEIYMGESEDNVVEHLINILYPLQGKNIKITIEEE